MDFEFDHILEVEDSLIMAKVFINPRTRMTANPDAYMTVVDFVALEIWTKEQKYADEQLKHCIDYWNRNVNVGPPLKIAGSMISFWRGYPTQKEEKNNGEPKRTDDSK
jgi:hypothetical protein